MVTHDLLSAAELDQRRQPENARAGRLLGVPQPRHDELQERRLDPALGDTLLDTPAAAVSQLDLPRRHLVEHGLYERWLDLDSVVRGQLVETVDWPDDGLAPRGTVEVVEPQVVPEYVRDPALEAVELRQGVFADREQEARAQARPGDGLGEVLEEAVGLLAGAVVEKVLLESVEDDED